MQESNSADVTAEDAALSTPNTEAPDQAHAEDPTQNITSEVNTLPEQNDKENRYDWLSFPVFRIAYWMH